MTVRMLTLERLSEGQASKPAADGDHIGEDSGTRESAGHSLSNEQ
jgi:hypothetical protein